METLMENRPLFNDQFGDASLAKLSNSAAEDRKFTVFPELPTELRIKIWQAAIEELQCRIIHIKLRPGRDPSVMMTVPPGDDNDGATSSEAGFATDRGDQSQETDERRSRAAGLEAIERRRRLAWSTVFPTLLRANSESRAAYLSIFRVAVPFGSGADDARKLVMHLGPDRDVLDLDASVPDPSTTHGGADLVALRARMVVGFLCSLRARDPRGVGVRRLSLGAQCHATQSDDVDLTVDDLLEAITPDVADESWDGGAAALSQILENLTSFFYTVQQGALTRSNAGQLLCPASKAHFALSVPASPSHRHYQLRACVGCVDHGYLGSTPDVSAFTWLDRDPRPHVGLDLQQFVSGRCPHESLLPWLALEERFGVRRGGGGGSAFRLFLAVGEGERSVFDRGSAVAHLKDESVSWLRWAETLQESDGPWPTGMGALLTQEQAAAVAGAALPAVGFWLWPSDVLGKLNAANPCADHSDNMLMVAHDMSGVAPELLVMHLA